MSRSFKKAPVTGYTHARSEKEDKRAAASVRRARFRAQLDADDLESLEFDERNVAHSNAHTFAKDGRQYVPVAVRRVGRATQVLAAPDWADARDVRKVLGK